MVRGAGNLNYLKSFNGRYPHDVRLLGNSSALAKRVKALLKTRFSFLKERWMVETPIEVEDLTVKAYGCQPHNCENINFITVVDLGKDVVYVGVKENDNLKIYSEDGSSNLRIIEWKEAKSDICYPLF
jgi:hypothetical protein